MAQNLILSLKQFISLTDEALVVLDGSSRRVRFASPRAMDILDITNHENANIDIQIHELLEVDGGRLSEFLADALTVSSPLVARVKRKSDGAPLIAKGHRVLTSDEQPCVLLNLTGNTELSLRFRLLAEKIAALGQEVEHRKIAERLLSKSAAALERILIAVRQMSEIDSSDPDHLHHALSSLVDACECSGAIVIGLEMAQPTLLAVAGSMADVFEANAMIHFSTGMAQFWERQSEERTKILHDALNGVATSSCDLSEICAMPLYLGSAPKACLVLQRPVENRNGTEILSEALAALMNRANIERNFRHAQKIQAIGQLTGGIAHDFNNILAIILGNAELLLDHVTPLGAASIEVELSKSIRDAAQRGATLTSRLLSFARKQQLKPQSLALNGLLRDLDTLLRRALGERVAIEFVGAGGLWKTRLDQGQFENAVLNLAVNARDAMPDGGKLTIETANSRLDEEYAAQHLEVTSGQYVMVAVSDTGTGMTPDVVREAFTPFFTTKGVGKGSGLGLSMVFGFVKQSGGHVKIYSELGHGTTVKMYFPRDTTDISVDHGLPLATTDRRLKAHGHILLVEDDPAILLYTERTLKILGYRVDTALTGDAAVGLLRSGRYDILLTDVVLPGKLNGAEVAKLARAISPETKVLFMSGYTENAIVHNGQLDPDVELISKPFTREQLARRLHLLTKA